jgi:aromatase
MGTEGIVVSTQRKAEHEIKVKAPADLLYRLLAEVENWPRVFPPTVHVEVVERGPGEERLRLWATANGEVKTWTSRRLLDPAARRIEFRQEVSQPPVARMGGRWLIEELSPDETLVTLEHDYAAVGDDPAGLEWIERAVDRNSRSELDALRVAAEQGAGPEELLFSFEDTVEVDGPVARAYEFVYEGALWQTRLPHVARVVLTEETPGLQTLEMDTRTKDGQLHTTRSVRVCLPHDRIVYKQLVLPALLSIHNGQWRFEDGPSGGRVTSRHTVAIDPAAVTRVLGVGATVAQARDFVGTALSANSLATLTLAKAFAEGEGR